MWLLFLLLPTVSAWCPFYDKTSTVEKIQVNLGRLGRTSVDREFFKEEEEKMPKIFSWAVSQIGVERAFHDCDSNKDGTITVEEMTKASTCLDSCFKLGIVNFAL